MRCPVPDSYNRDIDVTLLLREPDLRTPKDSPPQETTLIRFTLPWTQRTTGRHATSVGQWECGMVPHLNTHEVQRSSRKDGVCLPSSRVLP